MIIPIRCFSCGKVVADLYETYLDRISQGDPDSPDSVAEDEGEVMDQLGLNRYCCRRMIMTHVDLIEKLLRYNPEERQIFNQS